MSSWIHSSWLPIMMRVVSKIFMTFASDGHLKFRASPLWLAIGVGSGIAFFEDVIQVPANRRGSSVYSPYQLKIAQEVFKVSGLLGVSFLYLKVRPQWNHMAALLCILAAVVFWLSPDPAENEPLTP